LFSPVCCMSTQVLLLHKCIFRTYLFTIYDKLCVVNWLQITTTSIPYYKTFFRLLLVVVSVLGSNMSNIMLLIKSKRLPMQALSTCSPASPLPLHDVWRLPRPPPGAPTNDHNSEMMLHCSPAPRHHVAAPPLPAQGTRFLPLGGSKNYEANLVIWMSI
jgi:hypothetical protein